MSNSGFRRTLAYGRIAWTALGVVISAYVSWRFGDRLDNDPNLLAIVATIFSILAAALIAVVSILGDPSMLIDPSWRKNALAAKETQRKLHRKNDIFVLYLVTLGVLVAFSLAKKTDWAYPYLQSATLFFSVMGFWASLTIPSSLKEIQRKRLDDAIESRKAERQ